MLQQNSRDDALSRQAFQVKTLFVVPAATAAKPYHEGAKIDPQHNTQHYRIAIATIPVGGVRL